MTEARQQLIRNFTFAHFQHNLAPPHLGLAGDLERRH